MSFIPPKPNRPTAAVKPAGRQGGGVDEMSHLEAAKTIDFAAG